MRQLRPIREATPRFGVTYDQNDLYRDDKRDAYQHKNALEGYECEVCGECAHETIPDARGQTWLECKECGHVSRLHVGRER